MKTEPVGYSLEVYMYMYMYVYLYIKGIPSIIMYYLLNAFIIFKFTLFPFKINMSIAFYYFSLNVNIPHFSSEYSTPHLSNQD